jgi:very-short-patch-repair endonuclease
MESKRIAWNKGLTKENDKRVLSISKNLTNRIPWNKGKKGYKTHPRETTWNKGILHSSETKRKISDALKGRKPYNKGIPHNDETKQKMKNNHWSKNGGISWNKGLTKETNQSIMLISRKLKGRIFSNETRKKISLNRKGITPYNKGKKRPRDLVNKITLAVKKTKSKKNYIGNYLHPEYIKKKLSILSKQRWKNPTQEMLNGIQKSNNYPDGKSYQEKILVKKIENIYQKITSISKNKRIGRYLPDIILDNFNLIVEYDGLHFHKDLQKDIDRDKKLINLGYKIIHYRGYQPDELEIINDVNYMLENETQGLYKENEQTILNIN